MKKIALFVFLFLIGCNHARAGSWQIDVNLASRHLIDAPWGSSYNESNTGLGFEYALSEETHLSAGFYDNSIPEQYKDKNEFSYYAAIGKNLKTGDTSFFWKRYELGVEVGLVSGYKDIVEENNTYVPQNKINDNIGYMVGPYARLGEQHALKIRYLVMLVSASYQYEF